MSLTVKAKLSELGEYYCVGLERMTTNGGGHSYMTLPGVHAALEATAQHPRYRNTLLTGNLESLAKMKMRLVELDEFFTLPGAFGEDAPDRRELPAIAAARLAEVLQEDFTPAQFIVIGDTPNDIACARHFGARVISVATGCAHSAEQLAAHQPDALLDDLADTAKFIQTLECL